MYSRASAPLIKPFSCPRRGRDDTAGEGILDAVVAWSNCAEGGTRSCHACTMYKAPLRKRDPRTPSLLLRAQSSCGCVTASAHQRDSGAGIRWAVRNTVTTDASQIFCARLAVGRRHRSPQSIARSESAENLVLLCLCLCICLLSFCITNRSCWCFGFLSVCSST